MNFHEKISNFQSSLFSQFRCEIQVLFMRFHEFSWKISNFQSSFFSQFRCEIQVLFMRFHEFSWKISNSKFTFFPVQIRVSSIVHALSWIFMKKYQTFNVRSFPSSDVRFKYNSCASMNFHEKYQTFKVRSFSSSDMRFKYYSCAFMNFHEKISNFQSLLFSKFRRDFLVLFIRFHEFSWKNIKLSKFTLFPVQMWDSSIVHALSWIFMKKYKSFQSLLFSQFRCKIQVLFIRFHEFSWKISNFQSSLFFQFRFEFLVFFIRFHEFSWKISNFQS
jgi:hypothetical protein